MVLSSVCVSCSKDDDNEEEQKEAVIMFETNFKMMTYEDRYIWLGWKTENDSLINYISPKNIGFGRGSKADMNIKIYISDIWTDIITGEKKGKINNVIEVFTVKKGDKKTYKINQSRYDSIVSLYVH